MLRNILWNITFLSITSAAAAQASFIEADAPERRISGCYAVVTTGPLTLFELPATTGPDTIFLSLSADHYGTLISPPPRTSSDTSEADVDWRKSGWLLPVRPDPHGGLHSFAFWGMSEEGAVTITGGRNPKSYRITVNPAGDSRLVGELARIENSVEMSSTAVSLDRVSCPPNPYWNLQVRRKLQ